VSDWIRSTRQALGIEQKTCIDCRHTVGSALDCVKHRVTATWKNPCLWDQPITIQDAIKTDAVYRDWEPRD
jgi:hypothetical protein